MTKNKYEIQYSETFKMEIKNAFRYILDDLENSVAAENLIQLVQKEIEKRSDFPESFKRFKIERESEFKWYRINVNSYSILYTVDKNIITMSRFIYSGRDFEKLI